MKQFNLLAEDNRLDRISAMGDPLEKLSKFMDFKIFRPLLEEAIRNPDKDPKKGGRPPYDIVLMWKIVLLQTLYSVSNDSIEYLINDRLSFQRFLGLGLNDKVPDANTLWDFKEALARKDTDKKLFELFEKLMEKEGIITRTGSLVDATFAESPRQRNSRDENKTIKEGKIPEEWEKPENKNKLSQKDTDARWTKKNNETFFGYKDHAKVDAESKMIVSYEVTDASVHDSQMIVELCDTDDKAVYADGAYVGDEIENKLKEKCGEGLKIRITEKGYRNNPLTEEQKASNKEKSGVRARVEHVFGFIKTSMGGNQIRSIGIVRATATIGRQNLTYNIMRYVYLCGLSTRQTPRDVYA